MIEQPLFDYLRMLKMLLNVPLAHLFKSLHYAEDEEK